MHQFLGISESEKSQHMNILSPMISNTINLVIFLFILLVLSSCAAKHSKPSYYSDRNDYSYKSLPPQLITVKDQLPVESPRAYVEFHGNTPDLTLFGTPISLFEQINGEKKQIAEFHWNCRYRMAFTPGIHHFEIDKGTGAVEFKLNLKKEMISLVEVSINFISYDPRFPGLCGGPNRSCFKIGINASDTFFPVNITPESFNFLLEVLKNPHRVNRAYAVEALGNLKDTRATEPLISILLNKIENDNVRSMAAKALSEIGDPLSVNPLISILKDKELDDTSLFKREVASALGGFNDKRSIDALMEASESKNIWFSRDAMAALVRIGGSGTDHVIKFAKDLNFKNRISAIWVLGLSKEPEVLVFLTSLLKDKNKDIRSNAEMSIKKINKKL